MKIGNDITRQNKICLSTQAAKTNVKDIWTAIRQLTGRQRDDGSVDGITDESLKTRMHSFVLMHTTQCPL